MKILMTVVVAVIVVAGFSLMSAPEAEAGCAVGYGCGAAVLVPTPQPIPFQRVSQFRSDAAGAGLVSLLSRPVFRRAQLGPSWSHRLRRVWRRAVSLRRGPTTTGLRITTPTTPSRPMPVAVISALAIATGAGTAGTIRSAAASATKTFELPVRTG